MDCAPVDGGAITNCSPGIVAADAKTGSAITTAVRRERILILFIAMKAPRV